MKLLLSILLIFTAIVTPSPVFAADDTVEKTDCKLAIGYDSMDELKADLLLSAKRLAVNELFGELIAAATAVEDFVVTSDQIRASSLGLVREDSIRYYNGANLGEVCIDISVYTTDEDRQQFVPIKLNKRNCVSNPDMTNRELRKFAEEEAIVKAMLEYNRKLEGQDRDKLLNLMQRVTYLENGLLPDTDSYCVRVEGYVTPIEAVAVLQTNSTHEAEDTVLIYDDEFDGPSLNPNWYWSREDPSRWSLETVPGKLQIIATGGNFSNQCDNVQNILLQSAPSGDFELETKVFIRPTQNYQNGGLLIWDDSDNWVELSVMWGDGEIIVLFSEQNGTRVPNWPWTYRKLNNDGMFLKMGKIGNLYEGSYSSDGKTWTPLGSLSMPAMKNPQIGITAYGGANGYTPPNCSYNVPEIPVNFDFFHVNYADEVQPTQ